MQLSELYLDRYLYKDTSQDSSTKGSVFESANNNSEQPVPVPSGGAAQDINTSNTTINGGSITPGTLPPSLLDVSNWGWTQSCTFSSTDSDTVSWGAGTFTSAGGETYSIGAGNTGNMVAKTYIYLDLNVSDTAYQTTTTSANSVGIGKVLIGVAEDGVGGATYMLSEAEQIVADNILANTIDASKMNVGQLSAITADFGNMTAGTINAATVTINNLTVGTNVGIGTAFPTASAGDLAYEDLVEKALLGTTIISGGYILTSLLTASNIQTGTLNASLVTVTNINASNITTGTLYVGDTGQPSQIILDRNGTDGFLTWTGGNKIWSDGSEYMGFDAGGGRFYFYDDGNLMVLFQNGSQASFYDGINCQGNFNLDAGNTARFEATVVYFSGTGFNKQYMQATADDMRYYSDVNHEFYQDTTLKAIIDENIFTEGDLLANGSKPFLIPHPDGSDRMLRYTAQESPEVILRHRGKAVTGANSKVTITLPEHFTLVTDEKGDVTVNLTVVGDHRIFLQEEPTNSEIKIQSSSPSVSFHYEVMAVRDGFLNQAVELDINDNKLDSKDKLLLEKLKSIPQKNIVAAEEKIENQKKLDEQAKKIEEASKKTEVGLRKP